MCSWRIALGVHLGHVHPTLSGTSGLSRDAVAANLRKLKELLDR